jgi:hypothetical protein
MLWMRQRVFSRRRREAVRAAPYSVGETKAVGRRSVLEGCSRAGNDETKGVGLIVSRARSVVVWQ